MRLPTAGFVLLPLLFGASLAFTPATAQPRVDRTLSGTLEVIWRESEEGGACAPSYRLAGPDGTRVELVPSGDGAGSWPASIGNEVIVVGGHLPAPAAFQRETFQVRSLQAQPGRAFTSAAQQQPARGSKPYLTILCSFAGGGKTPKPASYFKRLMSDRKLGLQAYFRKVSYGALALEGSSCVGWVDLPRPLSAYNPGSNFNLDLALEDAVALAERQCAVSDYEGINLVFNQRAFGRSIGGIGGRMKIETRGQAKVYGVTWLSYVDQALFAHEMGHSFGLPHSSGPYRNTYDSHWDVMSQSYLTRSGKFGYIAQDTIGYHKDLLGWLPESSLVEVAPGRAQKVSLTPLCHGSGSCRLIKIPVGAGSSRWYTVEARLRTGLDKRLPGNGVVIHLVDTNRGDRVAEVVDIDRNGNPNDGGAVWTAGERFYDAANGVSVKVLSRGGDQFVVEAQNGAVR